MVSTRECTMPVIAVSVSFSVVFGTYRNVLQRLCNLQHGSPNARPAKCGIFLLGLTGGVAQVLLMSPAEMVKVRLQCQRVVNSTFSAQALKPKYHGSMHCLRTTAHEEGVLGLYKGVQALALRDGPFFATFLTTYNIICELLSVPGQTQPDWKVVLLAGGLSGMCGWCIGTPTDLIKTCLQMDWIGERRYPRLFPLHYRQCTFRGARCLLQGPESQLRASLPCQHGSLLYV